MQLRFLNREAELRRLRRGLDHPLVCVYGRRRLGKSRLLREALADVPHFSYVGDDRDAPPAAAEARTRSAN